MDAAETVNPSTTIQQSEWFYTLVTITQVTIKIAEDRTIRFQILRK